MGSLAYLQMTKNYQEPRITGQEIVNQFVLSLHCPFKNPITPIRYPGKRLIEIRKRLGT